MEFGVWLKTAELSVLICCNHKFSMHLTTWYLHQTVSKTSHSRQIKMIPSFALCSICRVHNNCIIHKTNKHNFCIYLGHGAEDVFHCSNCCFLKAITIYPCYINSYEISITIFIWFCTFKQIRGQWKATVYLQLCCAQLQDELHRYTSNVQIFS